MPAQLYSIGDAAKYLGISPKTLRRWEERGLIAPLRTNGNQRRYPLDELERAKAKVEQTPPPKPTNNLLTVGDAAQQLGVSAKSLRRWEDQGVVEPVRTAGGQRRYTPEEIEELMLKQPRMARNTARKPLQQPANPAPQPRTTLSSTNPPPIPPITMRRAEASAQNYGPRTKIIVAAASVITLLILWIATPPLTKIRFKRAFTPTPAANPIVDINDMFEWEVGEGEALRILPRYPLKIENLVFTTVSVLESATLNAARFLGTIFFGEGDTYYITPLADASLKSLILSDKLEAPAITTETITSEAITTESIDAEQITLNGVDLEEAGLGNGGGGDGEGGGGSGNASTLDSLDSSQFLRSDTSDNYTSGTLALNASTTLNILGTWKISGATVSSTAAELNLLDGETDVGLSILTDANIPNNLTISASGNINAAALTSGTVAVSYGGTGAASLTNYGVLVGSGTGAVTALAAGTDNQVLIGSTGADPAWGTIGAASITANSLDFSEFVDAMTVDATTTANLYNGAADVDLRFYNSDAGDELLFLDGSSGKIGIGTTSLGTRKLTVNAGSNLVAIEGVNDNSPGYGVLGSSNGSSGTAVYGSAAGGYGIYGYSYSGVAGHFTTASGYGLIVQNGDVGIGTTSPSGKFTIREDGLSYDDFIVLERTDGHKWQIIHTLADGNALVFAFNGNEILAIDDSDRVGIEDSQPDATLEVVGDFMISASSGGDGDRFIVNSSGNVGIGTTNPLAYTASRRNLSLVDTTNDVTLRLMGSGSSDAEFVTTGTGSAIGTRSNDLFNIFSNNQTRITIEAGGDVGIGTTNPDAPLQVAGAIHAPGISRIIAWTTGFSDQRTSDTGGVFITIPERTLSFTKSFSNSIIKLTYQDTLGQYSSSYNACTWGFYIDSTQVNYFSAGDQQDAGTYWDMENATRTALYSGLSAGTYTFTVKWKFNSGSSCLSGWNTINNYMMVEEVGYVAGSDLAEHYPTKDLSIETGDIVSADPLLEGAIINSSTPYDSRMMGIISTRPGDTLGKEVTEGDTQTRPVALSGRVPTKVSTRNGPIKVGDYITTSEFPGIGMKAVRAGTTVGIPLEKFDPVGEGRYCPSVASVNDINWPDDPDGENTAKPCFKLPDGTHVGKIMVFVNLSWQNPNVLLLSSIGDLVITKTSPDTEALALETDTISPVANSAPMLEMLEQTENKPKLKEVIYELRNVNNEAVTHIGAFAEAAIAHLKAGLIDVKELVAGSLRTGLLQTQELSSEYANIGNLSTTGGIVSPTVETEHLSAKTLEADAIKAKRIEIIGEDPSTTESEAEVEANQELSPFGRLLAQQATVEELIAERVKADEVEAETLDVSDKAVFAKVNVSLSIATPLLQANGVDVVGSVKAEEGVFNRVKAAAISVSNELEAAKGIFYSLTAKTLEITDLLKAKTVQVTGLLKAKTVEVAETLTAKLVKTKRLEADDIYLDGKALAKDSSGETTIERGKTKTTVKDVEVTEKSKIFLTPLDPTEGQQLFVSDKAEGQFEVSLSAPLERDLKFDYWIVN